MADLTPDPTNPPYYRDGGIEPIDVIEDWCLPHHLACVVKYMKRYREKEDPVRDLQKALWYLVRYIEVLRIEEQKCCE